jgi:anti-sigma regulatory factor (Ser/Thr protein kinase)/CHASE1-domain containing sensor protein/GAF domain-containing protein
MKAGWQAWRVTEPVPPLSPSYYRRPARRALVFVILLLLLIVTLLSWLFVRRREDEAARAQRSESVEAAASALDTSLRVTASALRGVPTIVRSDGSVDVDAFQAFGADVLADDNGAGLAYEAIVDGPDRAEFEARTGLTIKDQDAAGNLVPAATRQRYCPIVSVVVGQGGGSGSEGFDICANGPRREAADQAAKTGKVVMTAPIAGVATGRAGVSMFRALYRPGTPSRSGDAVGFVSLGTRADRLLATASRDLPKGVQLRVTDGDTLVFGPPAPLDALAVPLAVGGRRWLVQVSDTRQPSFVGSWIVLASGLVLIGLLTFLAARSLRYESQLEALTAAQERDVERTAQVARFARLLSSARGITNIEDLVRREAGRPFSADQVALEVADADEGSATASGGGQASDGRPGPVGSAGPLAHAMETDHPIVVENRTDIVARYRGRMAGFEDAETVLAVPLPHLTEGSIRGALGFAWTTRHELNLADLDVATTIAELVAGALTRARSLEQVRTKAETEEQRADIATALMDATTVDRVARRTLGVLARHLEVTWGYVAVSETAGDELIVRATLPDRREPLAGEVPVFDHLLPGVVRWTPDAVLRRLSGGDPIGRCEALVIPGGAFHAVVVAGWAPGNRTTASLHDVADLVNQAVLRARVFDREASTAAALQDALLTTDSHSADVVFTTRYRPAESPMRIGGDWYDLVVDRERVLVTVGDVVGQGLAAATVMGQLRSALRTALLSTKNPVDALEAVDRFAEALGPLTFATVAVAALDPSSDSVTFCYAGHPPLLHIARDGTVRTAEGGRSWPIGASWSRPRPRDLGRIELTEAETIILFTDGLFERRDESLDVGLERMHRAVEERASLPTTVLSDALLSASGDITDITDDAAVIVVRRTGSVPGRCFADVFPAHGAHLHDARQRFGAWLETLPLPPERHNDLLLAVNEAMANAVEHGSGARADQVVQVEAGVRETQLVIAVTDSGQWQEREAASPQRGRGLLIMRRLVSKVGVRRGPRGSTVTLEVDLALHPIAS